MKSERERLEESRDCWLQSVEHDRMQANLSKSIMWAGRWAVLSGAFVFLEGGRFSGSLAMAGGFIVERLFKHHADSELDDAFSAELIALERQAQIDNLDD